VKFLKPTTTTPIYPTIVHAKLEQFGSTVAFTPSFILPTMLQVQEWKCLFLCLGEVIHGG
jgi:hypothetical protein